MEDSSLDRLIALTNRYLEHWGHPDGEWQLTAHSAICQDAYIFGIDVDDYVYELEEEFGKVVLLIPWLRFTDQTASARGFGCLLFPFWLMYRLARLPFTGGPVIPESDPKNFGPRLELGHVAAVIEKGEWFEP